MIEQLRQLVAVCKPQEMAAQTKRSLRSLIVQRGRCVYKIVDPDRCDAAAADMSVDAWVERVQHEKAAHQIAVRCITDEQARCVRMLPDGQVNKFLSRLGFDEKECEGLLRCVLGFEWCPGSGIGYFSDEAHDYVIWGDVVHALGARCLLESLDRLKAFIEPCNEAGLFHNDLAPQNVLFANLPDGSLSVRVVDYGVSLIDDPLVDNQPRVKFIEDWYLTRVPSHSSNILDLRGAVRPSGVSKDLADIETLKSLIRSV